MTIGIEHVNDYPLIRFEIRFDGKFPIRRSLHVHSNPNTRPESYIRLSLQIVQ